MSRFFQSFNNVVVVQKLSPPPTELTVGGFLISARFVEGSLVKKRNNSSGKREEKRSITFYINSYGFKIVNCQLWAIGC